jgi:hypothetical protein
MDNARKVRQSLKCLGPPKVTHYKSERPFPTRYPLPGYRKSSDTQSRCCCPASQHVHHVNYIAYETVAMHHREESSCIPGFENRMCARHSNERGMSIRFRSLELLWEISLVVKLSVMHEIRDHVLLESILIVLNSLIVPLSGNYRKPLRVALNMITF